jgi:hypothetical protein
LDSKLASGTPGPQVELKQRGLPAISLEAWHARAALSSMRNKTDKADDREIAHIVRAGWFLSAEIDGGASPPRHHRLEIVRIWDNLLVKSTHLNPKCVNRGQSVR